MVLAWVGSSSTAKYLEGILPTLESAAERVQNLRLRIIADFTLSSDAIPVEECPWSQETEVSGLLRADIGVAPLTDDSWTRGKCGLKILQYMAAGLPVVASDVGVHGELIEDGVTGFCVSTTEQWIDAIAQLAANPERREQMGMAGRKRAREMFDRRVIGARLIHRIEHLLEKRA